MKSQQQQDASVWFLILIMECATGDILEQGNSPNWLDGGLYAYHFKHLRYLTVKNLLEWHSSLYMILNYCIEKGRQCFFVEKKYIFKWINPLGN